MEKVIGPGCKLISNMRGIYYKMLKTTYGIIIHKKKKSFNSCDHHRIQGKGKLISDTVLEFKIR